MTPADTTTDRTLHAIDEARADIAQHLTAALELAGRRSPLDQAVDDLATAAHRLRVLIADCRPLTASEARRAHDAHRGRSSSLTTCVEVLCHDKAYPGERRCDPCTEWLEDHPDARVVPRKVIVGRKYRRAERVRARRLL